MAKSISTPDSDLKHAVETLARQDSARRLRGDFGPPPSDQELRALSAGSLPEDQADRIRDFLLSSPEWAEAYLEMDQEPDQTTLEGYEATARDPDVDLGAARERFKSRLDSRSWTTWFPLVALVLVSLGLMVVLVPAWETPTLEFSPEEDTSRGGDREIDASLEVIKIRFDISQLPKGRHQLMLRDSSDKILASKIVRVGLLRRHWIIDVHRADLPEDVRVKMVAEQLEPTPGEEKKLYDFKPRYVDR